MRRAAAKAPATKLVWNLVVIVVITLIPVLGKRQSPGPDEIERVINSTHSVIWKCSNSECMPGMGLNVQCGTSIPFSMRIECVLCVNGANYSNFHGYFTCKSCKNCGKHENKKGECTREEDNIVCLRTCHKGYYWDSITEDCHQCSHCCGEAKKHHEKQCEDSELPAHQQCRITNIKCPKRKDYDTNQEPERQGSLQTLHVVAIVVLVPMFVVVIVVLVYWWCYGWEQVRSTVKRFCCCCCHLVRSVGENTVNFQAGDQNDLESAFCHVSGNHFVQDGDVLGTLASGALTMKPETFKRPVYQRLLSAPVETQSNFKLKIPRSFSHPGCLSDLVDKTQDSSDFKSGSKKPFYSPGARKRSKKGYTLVETEPPEVDALLGIGRDHHTLSPISSCEFSGNSSQLSGDSGDQVPDKKSTELEKPSAKDQCTSTTELQQSSTNQLADVPQEFLNSLLHKELSAIPIKFYSKICIRLDTLRQCFWDDYRMLAEKVGLEKDVTLWLGQSRNPTELILQKFSSQKDNSVGRFKAIVEEMERNDIVTIIQNWVLDEWNKQNNDSNSGKEYKLFSFV